MSDPELETLRRDRDSAREELARLRIERDQLRINALEPQLPDSDSDVQAELAALRGQVAELSVRAADLRRELDAHRATISWRITAPLRAFRARR